MAIGTPCFVIVMRSPLATFSSKAGRWVLAWKAPTVLMAIETSLSLVVLFYRVAAPEKTGVLKGRGAKVV